MASDRSIIIIDLLDLSPCDAINKIRRIQPNFADDYELNKIVLQKIDELYNQNISNKKHFDAKNSSNFSDSSALVSKEEDMVSKISKAYPPFTIEELSALIPQISRSAIYRVIAGL